MKKVDLLITNANILTLDGENTRGRSIAITDGRIIAIWAESEPSKNEINQTDVANIIDLQGATLMPGFIDTHNHILMYAKTLKLINCSSPTNKSIKDILERVSLKAKSLSLGDWVQGFGYDDTLLEDHRHPTKAELDQASPNNPVFIYHISGHLAVANSKAFEAAGINEDVSNLQGSYYGRDSNGKLNGVLYEPPVMKPIVSKIPSFTEAELITMLGEASEEYLAQGITTNTDASVSGNLEYEVHLKAAENGANPLKTRLMILNTLLKEGGKFGDFSAEQLDVEIKHRTNGRARLDSAKLFQDGSIQGLTGALREPYYCDNQISGELINVQQPFNEEILNLHQRGFRIAIHGNGDSAIGSILEAFENALNHVPRADHRHRIEHVQTATLEDLNKMEELKVAGSFFINHVYYWGDRHERLFLGPERAKRISPLADAVDRNLLFTLHSDCPITPISPLFSIWAAVNRITREGNVLGSEQKIDVITALKSMTLYGAQLNFDEADTGSIEVGKYADFAVLDKDPTAINPQDIKDIEVIATFINGELVYEKENINNPSLK